jgi:hypothetical protein
VFGLLGDTVLGEERDVLVEFLDGDLADVTLGLLRALETALADVFVVVLLVFLAARASAPATIAGAATVLVRTAAVRAGAALSSFLAGPG